MVFVTQESPKRWLINCKNIGSRRPTNNNVGSKIIPMRSLVSIAVLFAVCSCSSVSKDQKLVIDQVSLIHKFPVSRSTLTKSLNLDSIQSERIDGGVRGGHMWFIETWQLPTGTKVTGWDSEYVGAMKITERSIDDILNDPNRTLIPETPGDFINPFAGFPPRQTFKRITVSTALDKLIFDSMESKMKNDERTTR